MKARQFVNAAVTGYSLSRIKLKNNLFYPSTAEAQAVAMAAAANNKNNATTAAPQLQKEDYDELPVPKPRVILKPSSRQRYTDLKFLPFYGTHGGCGEGKVLCLDRSGLAALYDADACTVELMPGLGMSRGYGHPVSCLWSVTHADAADPALPNALYIMDREGSSFHALVYGDPISPWNRHPSSVSPSELRQLAQYGDRYAWHWRTLPTPPVEVIEDADFSFGRDNGNQSSYAKCYALLQGEEDAGATICVSFSLPDSGVRGGTYCFDTASHEWTKAGDWTLLFSSQAHHVPELGDGLLFGLESERPNRFCAMDVSGIKTNRGAPVLRHAWLEHAEPRPEWTPTKDDVVYLGDGRFCIHRTVDIMEQCGYGDWDTVDTVVLPTGVEVVRAPPGASSSKLRMVKHKSKRLDCAIESLL